MDEDLEIRQRNMLRMCVEPRTRAIAFHDAFANPDPKGLQPVTDPKRQKQIEFQSLLIWRYNRNEYANAYPELFAVWPGADQAVTQRLKDCPYRNYMRVEDLLIFGSYLLSAISIESGVSFSERLILSELVRYRLTLLRALWKKRNLSSIDSSDPFFKPVSKDRSHWVNPTLVVDSFRIDLATIHARERRILPDEEREYFAFFYRDQDSIETEALQVSEREAFVLADSYIVKDIDINALRELVEAGAVSP